MTKMPLFIFASISGSFSVSVIFSMFMFPYIISSLKNFAALQNPGTRDHVIGFLIVYRSNIQVCYFSLGVFHYHFHLSLADLWFPYSVLSKPSVHEAKVSLFPYVHKPILPVSMGKPSHDRKARNRHKFDVWFPFFPSFNISQVLPFVTHSVVLPFSRHLFKCVIIFSWIFVNSLI